MDSSSHFSSHRKMQQLTTTTTAAVDADKAWYILALLLKLGRSAQPAELASECTLFRTSPDFIHFLCSIPNSPLRLAQNYVTVSLVGLSAVAQFFVDSDVIASFLSSARVVPSSFENVRSFDVARSFSRKRKMPIGDFDFSLLRSNKRGCFYDFNDLTKLNSNVLRIGGGIQSMNSQVVGLNMNKAVVTVPSLLAFDFDKLKTSLFYSAMLTYSSQDCESKHFECRYSEIECKHLRCYSHQRGSQHGLSHGEFLHSLEPIPEGESTDSVPHSEMSLLNCIVEDSDVSKDDVKVDGVKQPVSLLQSEVKITAQACVPLTDVHDNSFDVSIYDSARCQVENLPIDAPDTDECHVDKRRKLVAEANNVVEFRDEPKTEVNQQSQRDMPKQPENSLSTPKADEKNVSHNGYKASCQTMENRSAIVPHMELHQLKVTKKPNLFKHKTKRNCDEVTNTRGKRETTTRNRKLALSTSTNNETEQQPFPKFESFIVEEEEGSGGYGTVYKARRKSDGTVFAIKSPHAKANRNLVNNELQMLQRFGGKHFVIKYEGSVKSENADCIVLEHVKHDRPEFLKREIDISQLQWYGYCMFKALAGLHKQGIVHRDVKPGNFLFSLKTNKGYLIDFNLALDLHRRQEVSDKSKPLNRTKYDQAPPPTKYLQPAKHRMLMNDNKFPEIVSHIEGKNPKTILPPGDLQKRKAKRLRDSQGADGSRTTSGTLSSKSLREPVPSTIRKEYKSLALEALQGEDHESLNTPLSQRKRVSASPQDMNFFSAPHFMDKKYFCPSPMPLLAGGIAVGGAGLLKGNGKHNQDGPCVGTKGFRAPEVLFRSLHQGPKMDVWSAGVTLLYMMIGRAPFNGDPEQNTKEIAKLRGSEDLWEVAKLHNHEKLFPKELLDVKNFLGPTKLRDWCEGNMRRRDFLEEIPESLFDLVDKCLTVNPRLRMSAEEALAHEFFDPCRQAITRNRLQRQLTIQG